MMFYGSGWSYDKTDEARSFMRHSNMMNLVENVALRLRPGATFSPRFHHI